MNKLWSFLEGKKTFIIAAITAVYGVGIDQHLWPHLSWVDCLLGAGGLTTLRMGMNSTTTPVTPPDAPKP